MSRPLIQRDWLDSHTPSEENPPEIMPFRRASISSASAASARRLVPPPLFPHMLAPATVTSAAVAMASGVDNQRDIIQTDNQEAGSLSEVGFVSSATQRQVQNGFFLLSYLQDILSCRSLRHRFLRKTEPFHSLSPALVFY
ncbi:unnamed protein product [Protopolystoma xenopodis]|uniref:Uncharacterized protein n=1 Tax=Protopolystoma xenopodis TaxID=117903 RepID=A0A3S4ZUL0_9PLAT|nr:unnamed protein product [Protopolystoma xenopodis]